MPTPLYEAKSASFLAIDSDLYARLASETADRTTANEFVIPMRSKRA